MQHVSAYGYPTPPASPSFDQKQPFFTPQQPEERLGRFLMGSLRLTGILGTGAYGVVYAAVDIKTNIQYAVKCLSKFNPDGTPLDRRQVAFLTREIRLHNLASAHPNVVSMLKIIDNPDCIYVILEYCPEGDLFYNITECGQYVGKDSLVKRVFLQILDAVEHCHSRGIYHRDLKPENILVSDNGETVKLADFGLATSSERSEDYGCGSTFYMSPECLDHASRRPFYYSAPNDVWSLGVVLVNLTCGRNPWKQASCEDSTYRAFTRNPGFLKTILPVSDELNDILGWIFTRDPEQRITLPELKARIMACSRFTEPPTAMSTSMEQPCDDYEESIMDDYEGPLSPDSSDSMSDDESTCSSDEGSSPSSIDDFDDDDLEDLPEAKTPPPTLTSSYPAPTIYEPEEPRMVAFPQEFVPQYATPPPEPMQPMHPMAMPVHNLCAPKFPLPQYVLDMLKHAQPGPQLYHPVPFHYHQPVHMFPPRPVCY